MGQLQSYLWAESLPMVVILIFVALVEAITIALFFRLGIGRILSYGC